MDDLVSTEWLAGELGKPDLVVFDADQIPAERAAATGATEFAAAHIPGARYFDIDEVADPDSDLPHMIPTAGALRQADGGAGRVQRLARGVLRPEGAAPPRRAAGG